MIAVVLALGVALTIFLVVGVIAGLTHVWVSIFLGALWWTAIGVGIYEGRKE